MMNKIKRAFTNNIGIKLLALVISFLLWLAVVNIDDPTQTRTFTAVVTVTNEDTLAEAGKLYEIKDGINTVSFRVTAKRSIIEKLSSSDFVAIADMNYLESEERVPVAISAKAYENYITISSKQNYLYVTLQDETNERFMINPKTKGETGADLAIENVKCSPTVITVSGAKEQVEKIASVDAVCDITGVTSDITENVIPTFYDSKGNEVDPTGLSLSTSTVDVSVDFANMKSVDINVKTSGVLQEGLELGSVTVEPSAVLVKGETVNLNDLTSINIPDTVINLSNAIGSYSTVVDISAYLPEGVSLADRSSSKATIYVKMVGDDSIVFDIPTKNLTFTNLAEGLTASIDADVVHVTVFGQDTVLASLNENDIEGTVDCSGLSVGEQQSVNAHFQTPEGVSAQSLSVPVTIVSGKTEESNEE